MSEPQESPADAAFIGLKDARPHLGRIARAAAMRRKRTALTDHGEVVAVVISPQELEELEDRAVFAEYELKKERGTDGPYTSLEEMERLYRSPEGGAS